MGYQRYFRIVMATVLVAVATACATGGGDVVTVRTVTEEDLSVLAQEEKDQLAEIKKAASEGAGDKAIASVLESTPQYTMKQYLQEHPEAIGRGGREYVVGGLDVLNIVVYEEPDLTREKVRVSADGFVSLPMIGQIRVADLTTSEVGELISIKLAQGQYLLNAHVSILVTEYNSKRVLVLGKVNNPGSYALQAQEKVLDVLSRSGGLKVDDKAGAGQRGVIIRTENYNKENERKIAVSFDLRSLLQGKDQTGNIYLMDQDVVYIPRAEHFYIMGEVKNPGSYPLSEDEITLVEAISMAGGFSNIAARNKTRIIRVEDGVEKILEVKVDLITDVGKKRRDVIIRPNDVIVVPESFF
ncbi:MAG: polysaccharide biosynthesis/export family protein [Pseudomonadota bacterium]